MHQLWQAVILKPLKLGECILHFWKPPIFINLVPTDQGHSCILNTKKSILKIAGFITVSLLGVYILFSITVSTIERIYQVRSCHDKFRQRERPGMWRIRGWKLTCCSMSGTCCSDTYKETSWRDCSLWRVNNLFRAGTMYLNILRNLNILRTLLVRKLKIFPK